MKDFDQALRTAAPGTIDGAKLLNRFAYEQLAVPSGGPVGEHFEGFIPALVQRDGDYRPLAVGRDAAQVLELRPHASRRPVSTDKRTNPCHLKSGRHQSHCRRRRRSAKGAAQMHDRVGRFGQDNPRR